MTTSSTEEWTTTVPDVPAPLHCDPTSDRPFALEFDGEELKDFLRTCKVDWTKPVIPNHEILAGIHQIFEKEVESGRYPSEALPSIKGTIEEYGGMIGAIMYENLPFELQVQIGVFTTIGFEIEDLSERTPETMIPALEHCLGTLGDKNAIQHHPYLEHLLRNLAVDFRKWYGPIAMGNIVQSTIGFLEACLIEAAYPLGVPCPPTASRYPVYFRRKSGFGDAYAHFLFPVTMFPEKEYFEIYFPSIIDLADWISFVNDILSFYKENVVGSDHNTYLMDEAKVLGLNPVDVWRDTVKTALALADQIAASLSRKEELKLAWLSFVNGYCRYHFHHRRYRLGEIGIAHQE